MRIGSSHLLMLEILEELRAEGVRCLNLGYTDSEALARFKAGFGAERIEVERVFVDVGSLLARNTRRLLKAETLRGSIEARLGASSKQPTCRSGGLCL